MRWIGLGIFRIFLSILLVFIISVSGANALFSDTVFRYATANITSGKKQSYDEGDGIKIFRSLAPDKIPIIVAIQEFNYGNNSPAAIREFVNKAFGEKYFYYREEGNYQIPNGIISPFPIIASGGWQDSEVPNRGYAWAQIKLPNGKKVWAYSVHLSTDSKGRRALQASELVRLIKKHVPNHQNEMLIIGGDLNTASINERAIEILSEIVSFDHIATDALNLRGTNANRKQIYDWVAPNKFTEKFEIPIDLNVDLAIDKPLLGKTVFPNGFILDTRTLNPMACRQLDDAFRDLSGQLNMQHMLSVKKYQIPD